MSIIGAIQTAMALGEIEKWNKMPEDKLDQMIKDFKDGDEKTVDLINNVCYYYTDSKYYKESITDVPAHKICCETVDYCSFYKQMWFYFACGGGVLLIIIILGIVLSCCCCCKGRRGGGKDLESSESSEESTKDEQETN
ncbi:unnamed protein product [Caenorhabditis nigoni]